MKTLQITTSLLFLLISFMSCNSNNKVKRKNEPTIYKVGEDDAEMNKALEHARQTIDSFDYAFKHYPKVFTFFSLKKKFQENGNVEHIWIGNIQGEANGKYVGVIDNLPEKIKNVKLGDTIEIDKKDISDWMYLKNNSELHGGYTIRLLRERMTEDERKKFDAESGMKIK